ncbi:nucleoside-diphosphate sugar epimerase [Halorhodospira abdelmalekii]|uniref:SDR family oxidoreductase n=1 Tax=Halorhodospira abdelmalekii TaxID=421629 RepID=UPI001903FC2F|nr:SDR family oxidoreductase [Halorhodospira abdelmalekii]MBK1734589.1 nucleoside-diphosphate sugar epimerase [Halorhodospira abdelmalekii]
MAAADRQDKEGSESQPAGAATGSGRRLVFGATGYIGSHLVPQLLAAGQRVRAAARNPQLLEGRGWEGVEVVAADALRPETLAPALADVSVAYYLVHSMAAGSSFGELDRVAAQNFAQAAAAAGVERIVYLGGLVPDSASSAHIVSRRETGEVLRQGSVPVTELRAGIIVGPGSAAFEVMRDLVLHLPIMTTPRWVFAQSPPIALDDLLAYLRKVAEIPQAAGKTFDVAGPEHLTYAEMMRQLAEVAGRRPPRIIAVPLLTPRLSSYWLKLVTAVPTPIARALIEGLREDYTADDQPLRELIPQPLMDFRSAVRQAFAAERDHAVAARWTEGALVFRGDRLDYSYYAKRASGSAIAHASPATLWAVITAIGGEQRYYYANTLWRLRELADRLIGGPGMNYGRRHPTALRPGDAIDSWRVLALEPEQRLTLWFGMRAPGAGVLEFAIEPEPEAGVERCRVTVTAYWHPAGVWGLLYWYAMAPGHLFIFPRLARAIARRAECREEREG